MQISGGIEKTSHINDIVKQSMHGHLEGVEITQWTSLIKWSASRNTYSTYNFFLKYDDKKVGTIETLKKKENYV
jgi:hypothetical protein